eukprot:UN22935
MNENDSLIILSKLIEFYSIFTHLFSCRSSLFKRFHNKHEWDFGQRL